MRKKLKTALTLCLCLVLLLALPALALEPGKAAVTADALHFRTEPSTDGKSMGLALQGTEVELVEDLGEWSLVRWNDTEGYMASRYLEQTAVAILSDTKPAPASSPAPAPETLPEEKTPENVPEQSEKPEPRLGFLTGDAVRFRAAPSLTADVYDHLYSGTRVTVMGLEGDWYLVEARGRVGYIYADYVAIPEESAPVVSADKGLTEKILQLARDNLGAPYCYGGTSPEGFDCSGFVYYCYYLQNGVSLGGRTATDQYNGGLALKSQDELLPGDLVFFCTPGTSSIGHVGVYTGDREFIHASTGSWKIKTDSLDGSYWVQNYYGACRVLNEK
jgi:cell wall-associated NlpC family hydrolase